jgi:hypothetical protein
MSERDEAREMSDEELREHINDLRISILEELGIPVPETLLGRGGDS